MSMPQIAIRPTFFVRMPEGASLPTPAELERHLRRWIIRELSGWLQLAVLELLDDGSVQWGNSVAGARTIAVSCTDITGPRRPGLWAALSVAHAIAELLGGCVVDARRAASFAAQAPLRAPADGRVHAIHHLCIPPSRGRLGSVGMAHFGLPDLELLDVPETEVEHATRLLLGVAQQLIEGTWAPSDLPELRRRGTAQPLGLRTRELLLTTGELHRALGGEADAVPISTGRGWTRVALQLHGRAGLERLRLGPPSGARQWRDRGAWLSSAWEDLFGRSSPQWPEPPARRGEAPASVGGAERHRMDAH